MSFNFKGPKFGFGESFMVESFLMRFKSSDKLISELDDTWLIVRQSLGPKELGGSVDLLNHYRLRPHHEFFCKKSLPVSVSETHYLQNVVGDREIRKGDGMELDPLSKNVTLLEEKKGRVHPFRLDVLADVFHMQETATLRLSSPNRGTPATMTKLKSKSKDTHHKKSKDRNKRKAKDKKDHSHQSKGIDDNRAKDKERDGQPLDGQEHLISQEKKRRCNGNEYPPRAQRLQQMSNIFEKAALFGWSASGCAALQKKAGSYKLDDQVKESL